MSQKRGRAGRLIGNHLHSSAQTAVRQIHSQQGLCHGLAAMPLHGLDTVCRSPSRKELAARPDPCRYDLSLFVPSVECRTVMKSIAHVH